MNLDYLPIIEEYLPSWAITGTIFIAIILFIVIKGREAFSKISWLDFLRRKKLNKTDLNNHQFFVFINHMEKYKIDQMVFGDPGRTKIFRDYFKIRCQIFNDNTKQMINNDLSDLSTIELKCVVLNTLYKSLTDSHTAIINQCSNDEERFVVNYVVEKFAKYTNSSIEAFKEVIETIFDNEFAYDNDLDRINAMLNIFLFVFVATFAESEKILAQVNGSLTNKNYKGIIIK